MARYKVPSQAASGADSFSDELVGNQFTTDSSLMTGANFAIEKSIPERDSKEFITQPFSNFLTLDDLKEETAQTTDGTTSTRDEGKIEFNNDKEYADRSLYGSLKQRIGVTIKNIISKYPAGLYIDSTTPRGSSRLTAEQIVYDPIANTTEFKIQYSFIYNPFEIVLQEPQSTILPETNNSIRNFYSSYTKYDIELSGQTYNILSYTEPDTNNKITIKVAGRCFSGYIGFYESYLIKPNNGVIENFYNDLDDLERVLLNRETYPIFNAGFNVPRDTHGGSVTEIVTQYVNWPTSKDGWNIQIVGLNFDLYVEKVSSYAEEIDNYKSNLVVRFLTSPQLYEFDTEEKKIESIFQIYGQSFDKVKKFIDNIAYMRNITYDGINNVPDVLLKNLAETLGLSTVDLFDEKTLQESLYTRHDPQYVGIPTGINLIEAEVEFYRRILVNLAWLYKSKGTRKAIEFFLKFIGAPEPMIRLDEYIYRADGGLSSKTVEDDIRSAIQGTRITNVATYDEDNGIYSLTQITGSTSLSRDTYPVYENIGLPRGMEFSDASMFFAKGAGWYRRTLDHRSPDIIDVSRSDLSSRVKVVKTMAKPFTYGEDYFNVYRQLPGLDYGFNLSNEIDNKKIEVVTNELDSKLILNRKNINIFISSDRGIDYDIYRKSRDLTITFGTLTPQTGVTFAEFLNNITSTIITNSHVIKYKDSYVSLLQVYNQYQENVGFTPYNYISVNEFVNRLSPYWTSIVEQFIPSTTQWTGGNLIENGIFNRSKFKHRQPCVPMIYREKLYPDFSTIIYEDLETLIGGGTINGEDQSSNFRGLQLFGGISYDVNLNVNGTTYYIASDYIKPFTGFTTTSSCTILTSTTESIPLICDYSGSTLSITEETINDIKSEWKTTLNNIVNEINLVSTGETGFTITVEYYFNIDNEEYAKFTIIPNDYYGCSGYETLDYYFIPSYGITSGCTLEVAATAESDIIYTGISYLNCQLQADIYFDVQGVGDENGGGPFYARTGCTENGINVLPLYLSGCTYVMQNVQETDNYDIIFTDASNCEQKMTLKGLQLVVVEPTEYYFGTSGITAYPIMEYKPTYNHGLQVGTKVYSGDTTVITSDSISFTELQNYMSSGDIIEIDVNDIIVGSDILCVELKPYSELSTNQFNDATISGYSFAFNYKFITVTAVDCLTTTKISTVNETYQVLPTSKILVYTNIDTSLNTIPYRFDYKYPEDLYPGDLLIDYSGFTTVVSGTTLDICSTDNYKTYYKQINLSNSNGTNIIVNGNTAPGNKIIVSFQEEIIELLSFDLRQYFIGLGIDESSPINTSYYRDFSIVSGYTSICSSDDIPLPSITPTPTSTTTPGSTITPTPSITPSISVSSSIPATPTPTPSVTSCPITDPFGTGLQSCWDFEESGTTIYDYTVNNHDLDPQGTIYYQESGKTGSYAVGVFDKYTRLTGDTGLNLTRLSISVWFKTSGVTAEYTTRYIFSRQSSLDGGYSVQLPYSIGGNGVVFMTNNQYSGGGAGPVVSADDGNWHHFVVTYDNNSGIAHHYFDGVYYGTHQHTTFIANTSSDTHITVGNIDSTYHEAYDSPFFGWIDGLGVWDRELSYCEVMTLWNNGDGRTCSFSPVTPSPTASTSPTVTPSITPSISISATPGLTPTVTPSLTPSLTPTASITPTISTSMTPSLSISSTPSISVSPQSASSIYFDSYSDVTLGSVGIMGVDYPNGRTFSITFTYQLEAVADNVYSNGENAVQAVTYLYYSTDSGSTWTEADYVIAEIPGNGPPDESDVQIKNGTFTLNGITDVNGVRVMGNWDCTWTQDSRHGTVDVTITNASVDTGAVTIICNNQILMGCLQTTTLLCGVGVTPSLTPSLSKTPTVTPSISPSIGTTPSLTPSTSVAPLYIGFDNDGNIPFTGLSGNIISLQIRGTARACQSWINCDFPPEGLAEYTYTIGSQTLQGEKYESSARSWNKDVCSEDIQTLTFTNISSSSTTLADVTVSNNEVYCGEGWGQVKLEILSLTILSGSTYIAIDPLHSIYYFNESTIKPTPSVTPTRTTTPSNTPSRTIPATPSRTPSITRTPSRTPSNTPVAIYMNITNNSEDNTIENVTIDGVNVWGVTPAFPYYPSDSGSARSPKVDGTYSVGVYLGGTGIAKYATLTDSNGSTQCVNVSAGLTYFVFTNVYVSSSGILYLTLNRNGSCPSPTPSISLSRTRTPSVTPSRSISASLGTSTTPSRTPSKSSTISAYGYNVNLYTCSGIACGDYVTGAMIEVYTPLVTGNWYKLDDGNVIYILSTAVLGGDNVNISGGPYGSCDSACGG